MSVPRSPLSIFAAAGAVALALAAGFFLSILVLPLLSTVDEVGRADLATWQAAQHQEAAR